MHIIQSRRDFLAGLSAAGAAVVIGGRTSLADEEPPETTTIKLAFTTGSASPHWISPRSSCAPKASRKSNM